MDWLNTIVTITSLIIGFILAQVGDLFKEKKERKRKLNKLIFNLLQLHYFLKKEYNFENEFDKFTEKIIPRIPEKDRENAKNELTSLWPKIKSALRNSISNFSRIEYLEKNIDIIIEELSEIFPIFAFELSEEYKIKEKLQNFDTYLSKISEHTNEVPPIEIKEWFTSKLTSEIITNIENHIKSSAFSINRKTKKAINKKLNDNEVSFNESFIDEHLNEFYKKYNI